MIESPTYSSVNRH